MFSEAYRDLPVFVTGHTGFKGSWLTSWLLKLGAAVHGYSLDPSGDNPLFEQLGLDKEIESDVRSNICDLTSLHGALKKSKPAIVFHLAAQPLVLKSFEDPRETFETNILGTVNLLDSLRQIDHPCTVVVVTTDKCYENREWLHAYREEDPMGGFDPYSASKGCAELIVGSYRNSFFPDGNRIRLASARAGNVIGGGDWAKDRIVPDVFRALAEKQTVAVRNRTATRPWQHVLEPLSGYLWLAACMHFRKCPSGAEPETICSGFNFGPSLDSNKTVAQLVEALLAHTGGEWSDQSDPSAPHEASKLNLAIDKAHHLLHWKPTWAFEETIRATASWYTSDDPTTMTLTQLAKYERDALTSEATWALK